MILLLGIYFALYFMHLLLLVFCSMRMKDEKCPEITSTPFVSILIAARNEARNLPGCLDSIAKLDYPQDRFEVLVGDDASEDDTYYVAESFISRFAGLRVFHIIDTLGNARGKANVLAHLAQKARGDLLLITDADITVPPGWIRGLLGHYNNETGIISGVTVADGPGMLARLQTIEWAMAFGMIKIASDAGIPVTAVGNNMLVSKQAYISVGGYENLPFSITEDFELFRHVVKKGWRFKNLLNTQVCAFTRPAALGQLLVQRRRWMSGAVQVPVILVLGLIMQSLFFPAIAIALVLFPAWAALLWLAKIGLLQWYLWGILRKIKTGPGILIYAPLFEIYSGILSLLLLVYYILPLRVEWKGRKYA